MVSEAFSILVIAAQIAALDPLMVTCTSTIKVFLLGFELPRMSATRFYSKVQREARVDDSQQLSRFMGYVCSKLAREVGRLTGRREKIFSRRYQAILSS
jgi:hypothetical protein